MSKSHVSMEKKICSVCGQPYETNSILIDKRLKESMEMYTVTGFGMCEEHQKMKDDGFIALIEVKNQSDKETINQRDADRTGRIAHLKLDVFEKITNMKAPSEMIAFVDNEFISVLEKMASREEV